MTSRILVVDDAPANIQTLSAVLKAQGYQISIAVNGRQALEVLERVRPDLILLDIMMPEMDGFETCQRIKASTAWREIPIIFLTAKTETADIVRGFDLGAVDYVAKPFSAHELLARVKTHLTLDHLFRENQRLLLNVLPASIAEKLKQQVGIIAERFEDVTVLFADIVNFTPMSARLSPTELVELLNRVFSGFDELAGAHRAEKIKTIGDAYMVAGGLIDPDPDHVAAMAGDGHRHAGQRRPTGQRAKPAYRPACRRRGCRRHRHSQVHLRHLGRHGEHSKPAGIARRAWPHSRQRRGLPAAAGPLCLRVRAER